MKNQLAFILITLAVLSSLSHAAVLDLDENNIIDGTYIIQDGTVYNIVYRAVTYFNGFMLKRLVVENADQVSGLQKELDNMTEDITHMNQYILDVENKVNELEPEATKLSSVLDIVKQQLEKSNEKLSSLKERQDEIKNIISSNLLVSSNNFNLIFIIFIVLLILVVLFKGFPKFMGRPEANNSGRKKGSLEMVAEQIKGKPKEETDYGYSLNYDVKNDNDKS